MKSNKVEKDERTAAIQKQSYAVAYWIMIFSILVDIAFRAFMRQEASWDLFAIVFLGSGIATVYQARARIMNIGCLKLGLISVAVAAVTAVVIVLIRLTR